MHQIYVPPEGSTDFNRIFSIEIGDPAAYGRTGYLFLRPSDDNAWALEQALNNQQLLRHHKIRFSQEIREEQPVLKFMVTGDNLQPQDVLERLKEAKVITTSSEWKRVATPDTPPPPRQVIKKIAGSAAEESWISYRNTDVRSDVASVQFSGAGDSVAGVITFWSDGGKKGEMTLMENLLREKVKSFQPAGTHGPDEKPVWAFSPGTASQIEIRDNGKVVGKKGQFTLRFTGDTRQGQDDFLQLLCDARLAAPAAWRPAPDLPPPEIRRGRQR